MMEDKMATAPQDTTSERIDDLVAEILCVDQSWVTPDAVLSEAPGADSLDIIELQMAIEDAFRVSLPDHELEQVVTVADLTALVEAKLNAAANP
ncbi:acyl carrier protein [Erythrobacter phage vB_EliS_R6L]|nr:acyl carrier protein [Erythrobacter phage vB_EliS_R6L]